MTRTQRFLINPVPWVLAAVGAAWAVIVFGAVGRLWRPDGRLFFLLVISVLLVVVGAVWRQKMRERFLRESPLPQYLKRKLRDTYPQLSSKDCDLVERGMRQFFLACSRSHKKFVAMPSKAVDAMWHEFILHTQAYSDWCHHALGHFLHHTPAEVLGGQAKGNDGLRRAWYWACKDEAINPKAPSRLPLLFALDAKLGIANGFTYLPDCKDIARKNADGRGGGCGGGDVYCGTSFSDGSHSGSSGDFGGADTSTAGSDGGSGDGGGDGGGGCGGGD